MNPEHVETKRVWYLFVVLLAVYWISEFLYVIERRLGSAPDPETVYKNIQGVLTTEWVRMLIHLMPDDYDMTKDRPAVLKAFMYGCNPGRVSEALLLGKAIVPYCIRYKDGIM